MLPTLLTTTMISIQLLLVSGGTPPSGYPSGYPSGSSVRVEIDEQILKHYITIGFFSSCLHHEDGIPIYDTDFHAKSNETKHKLINILKYNKNHNLRFFDVCDDEDLLVELMTDLFLNQDYFMDSKEQVVKKAQNIIFVVAYVTEIMSTMIERIIGALHPHIARLCSPHNCDHRYPHFKIQDYILQISDFLNRFGMHDVTFVNLIDQDNRGTTYQKYVNASYEHLKNQKKFCLKIKEFDLYSMYRNNPDREAIFLHSHFTSFVLSPEVRNSIIVVFGDVRTITFGLASMLIYLDNAEQLSDRIIIFQDINMSNGGFGSNKNIIDMSFVGRQELFFHDVTDFDYFSTQSSFILSRLIQYFLDHPHLGSYIGVLEELYGAMTARGILHNTNCFTQQEKFYGVLIEKGSSDYILKMTDFPMSEAENWHKLSQKYLDTAGFQNVSCPRPNCPPGHRNTYGPIKTVFADQGHAMHCELCPINTIKRGTGDSSCVPCSGELSVDNGFRTACVDPYTSVSIAFNNEQHDITMVMSCFGCCLTIFILIVFIINHDTPIVRSSDKILSIMHLISLFMVFITVICLYTLPYLKATICICRNLIFSIAYTLHVACLYTKSQKLVTAFASRIRLSASEVRNTNVIQILTTLMLLLSTNTCLVVTYFQIAPSIVSSQKNHDLMIRYRQCNTLIHQNIQTIFLTIFQIICSVQAYRCLKLPDVMNEAMSLFYSILITSISFGVSFPISYFRRQQIDKEFIGVSVLMINCFVTLFLLYAKKCYIILLKPQKNTRRYFNNRRMQHAGLPKE